MLKVLLVDDEILARQYLRQLIDWEAHGFSICGEASSGLEAVALLERLSPHILIADINMTGMDGVDLSRYVHEHYGDEIRMIMLSGYDNYEYVRETMKNGAADYLLKHRTGADALLEILANVRREIAQRDHLDKGRHYLEQNWAVLNREVARTYVRGLVLGAGDNFPELEAYFRHLSPIGTCNFIAVAMQAVELPGRLGKTEPADKNKRTRAILDLTGRSIGQDGNGIVAEVEPDRFALLFSFQEERSEHVIAQRLHAGLQRIAQALEMYLNLRVSFGCGPVCQRLAQIPAGYAAAVQALEQRRTAGARPDADAELFTLSLRQEQALTAAVGECDIGAVETGLEAIFADLGSRPYNPLSVSHAVNELIQLADKLWRQSGNGASDYFEEELLKRSDLAGGPEKLNDICGWTKRMYRQLIGRLSGGAQLRGCSVYVQLAIQYVNDRYADNVSLDMAAEQAGISSTYLGRLFKQETGEYFTDYLNRVRIEAAKRLIRSGNVKVKHIFERVGFTSYNYFFKVFKDFTGMTPHTYAKGQD